MKKYAEINVTKTEINIKNGWGGMSVIKIYAAASKPIILSQ